MKAPGIYQIRHIESGKLYVGSSVEIAHRWEVHLSDLKHNKHHSSKLQNAWNKYGASGFTFEIIEICDKDTLLVREQYFIDSLRPFYNCSPVAGRRTGRLSEESIRKMVATKLSQHRHTVHTPESKERIRQAAIAQHARQHAEGYVYNVPGRGKPISLQAKEKIRAKLKGRPSPNKGKKMPMWVREMQSRMRKGKPNPRKKKQHVIENGN